MYARLGIYKAGCPSTIGPKVALKTLWAGRVENLSSKDAASDSEKYIRNSLVRSILRMRAFARLFFKRLLKLSACGSGDISAGLNEARSSQLID